MLLRIQLQPSGREDEFASFERRHIEWRQAEPDGRHRRIAPDLSEGRRLINRVHDTSEPSTTYGAAAYLKRQLTSALSLATRFEYLKDRDGFFSGTDQASKEVTITGTYQFPRGFQAIGEYRSDFSNRPFFITSTPSVLASSQDIATVALLWSFGGKQGSW